MTSPEKYEIKRIDDKQVLINAHRLNVPNEYLIWETGVGLIYPPAAVEREDKADSIIRRKLDSIAIHQRFVDETETSDGINFFRIDHDIALIKLDMPVAFNMTKGPWTSCLSESAEFQPYIGKTGLIIGWGQTDEWKSISPGIELQKTNAPIDECDSFGISKNFICISAPQRTQRSGPGDSGGPLLLQTSNSPKQFTQIGITSFGINVTPGQGKAKSGFTRIAEYLPWIEENVKKLGGRKSKACKRK